jgi:hypothetical protein
MQVKKFKLGTVRKDQREGGMRDKKFNRKLKRAAKGRSGERGPRSQYGTKSKTLGLKSSMEYDHMLDDKELDRKNIRLARRRKKKFKARLIDPRKRKTIGDKLRANRVIKQQKKVDKRRDEVLAGKGGTDKGREEYAKLMAEKEAIKDARKKKKA